MTLSEDDYELVAAFLEYVEGIVEADDRYGPAMRSEGETEGESTLRFDAGNNCWFEVTVRPTVPQVAVSFRTQSPEVGEEFVQSVSDAETTIEAYLGGTFAEAGLDWPDPTVTHDREADGGHVFSTTMDTEDCVELERSEFRGKVVRVLEGYLIAFGPAIEPMDGFDEADDDEHDD